MSLHAKSTQNSKESNTLSLHKRHSFIGSFSRATNTPADFVVPSPTPYTFPSPPLVRKKEKETKKTKTAPKKSVFCTHTLTASRKTNKQEEEQQQQHNLSTTRRSKYSSWFVWTAKYYGNLPPCLLTHTHTPTTPLPHTHARTRPTNTSYTAHPPEFVAFFAHSLLPGRKH